MIAAVIDIGSNSVLLLTVTAVADGRVRAVDEALATTRLGSGLVRGGRLDGTARGRTREAVTGFAARARAAGATRLWAFATGAVRDAADGAEFAQEVAAATGVAVEVLSGDREAHLAWDAVQAGLGLGAAPLVVADVGGRTTELTLGRSGEILAAASLPVGALALTEACGDDPAAVRAAVLGALAVTDLSARARALGARLAASGGTATALAALDLGLDAYDARRVHGHTIDRAALATLARAPAGARGGLDPDRAAILPAGAAVLEAVATAVDVAALTVSDHGVRHAYLRAALGAEGIRADSRELWS